MLSGLNATDKIEFSTNADFALTTHAGTGNDYASRVIFFGVKLTDEALSGNTGGDNTGGDNTGGDNTGGDNTDVKTVSVAEFLATVEGDTATYQLTGKITGTYNTDYGNFYLKDATGEVLIYGLYKDGEKCYTALGLTDGDTITVQGVRGFYNSAVQMKNAEYVSHQPDTTPRIVKVTPSSMSFNAEGGSNTITVTTAGEGGTLAATSDADWATVSVADNVVTIATSAHEGEEVRSATITITYGDTSATVNIEQAAPLAEGVEAWVMVTDASTLAAGDQVVIVATDSNAAMSTNQNNNRGQATITKSANTVVINNEVQIFTLEAGTVANTWAFKAGDTGYLYASSSSSNHLKTGTLNEHASWSIAIEASGVATVKSQGGASRNWMRHNESSSLFSCYASGQKDIAIYKLTK